MMYRCLLWGAGQCLSNHISLVRNYETIGIIAVEGITGKKSIYRRVFQYEYIEEDDISVSDYDIVLVMADGTGAREIEKDAMTIGFSYCRIIPYKVLLLYGFSFDKYIRFRSNVPSIFCPSCWGGITYNRLGVEFLSPLINMSIEHDDFLIMMMNLEEYLQYDLQFEGWGYECVLKRDYPIMRCGEVLLHCNHYFTEDEAREAWDRRKTRINWDNIFVMMFDTDKSLVDRFLEIPFKNKICFTNYNSGNSSHAYIDYPSLMISKDEEFGIFLNGVAQGKYIYYDVLDLLNDCVVSCDVEYV